MTPQEHITLTKYDLYYESRMTKMETISEELKDNVKEIKTDLRWMLGLMLMFSGIMLGMMAKGFHWY